MVKTANESPHNALMGTGPYARTKENYIKHVTLIAPIFNKYVSKDSENVQEALISFSFSVTENLEYLMTGDTPYDKARFLAEFDNPTPLYDHAKESTSRLEEFLTQFNDEDLGYRARNRFEERLKEYGRTMRDAEEIFLCLFYALEASPPKIPKPPSNRPRKGKGYFYFQVAESLQGYHLKGKLTPGKRLARLSVARMIARTIRKLTEEEVKYTSIDIWLRDNGFR